MFSDDPNYYPCRLSPEDAETLRQVALEDERDNAELRARIGEEAWAKLMAEEKAALEAFEVRQASRDALVFRERGGRMS